MSSTSIVPVSQVEIIRREESEDWMPVFSMESALRRRDAVVAFVQKIMVPGTDFGVIPGTGNKPVLLKPGAERLCSFFGLSPEFVVGEEVNDWIGRDHNGELFFYVKYQCRLSRNGKVIGCGEGSCSSWESKYRWRKAERKCPTCNGPFIIKGKVEYGGGWLCYKKKGGCGAKFADGDKSIEGQSVDRMPNPDIADQVNTIQKMAQKRALIAAVLIGVNASEFFTQDLEDTAAPPGWGDSGSEEEAKMVIDHKLQKAAEGVPMSDLGQPDPRNPQRQPEPDEFDKHMADHLAKSIPPDPPPDVPKHSKVFSISSSCKEFATLKQFAIDKLGEQRGTALYYRVLGQFGVEHANELKSAKPARECYRTLAAEIDAAIGGAG